MDHSMDSQNPMTPERPASPGIVIIGAGFFALRHWLKAKTMVYTVPIDAYFDYCHGPLPYRSLRFEHEHLPGILQHQPVAVVNYPNDHAYTRITEAVPVIDVRPHQATT